MDETDDSAANERFERLVKLANTLLEDVVLCEQMLDEADSAAIRRQLVRAVFAHVEGAVWLLKQAALEEAVNGWVEFSPGEMALLREHAYELTARGKVKTRAARIVFAPNVRFAFEAHARAMELNWSLSVEARGWACLQRSLQVRHRLMHPKMDTDLEVTSSELRDLRAGHFWFCECLMAAQQGAAGSLTYRGEHLLRQARMLERMSESMWGEGEKSESNGLDD